MTYQQYWYGEIRLAKAYAEAERFRLEQREYDMWLQGAYVREALQSALSVSEFFRAKGAKPLPYPDKPYGVWHKRDEQVEAERKRKQAEGERLRAIATFDAMIRANKARRGEYEKTPSE